MPPISILLVDNSAAFRASMHECLDAESGQTVVGGANDGVATIGLVEELSSDIVIMDVIMPDMNGIETTHQIVALYPGVEVIPLSMHTDNRFTTAMRNAGASGYVFKDRVREDLTSVSRQSLYE